MSSDEAKKGPVIVCGICEDINSEETEDGHCNVCSEVYHGVKKTFTNVNCLKCKRLEVDCPYEGRFDIGMVINCDEYVKK